MTQPFDMWTWANGASTIHAEESFTPPQLYASARATLLDMFLASIEPLCAQYVDQFLASGVRDPATRHLDGISWNGVNGTQTAAWIASAMSALGYTDVVVRPDECAGSRYHLVANGSPTRAPDRPALVASMVSLHRTTHAIEIKFLCDRLVDRDFWRRYVRDYVWYGSINTTIASAEASRAIIAKALELMGAPKVTIAEFAVGSSPFHEWSVYMARADTPLHWAVRPRQS